MSKTRMARLILTQEVFAFAVPPHRRGPRRTKDSKVSHSSREQLDKGDVAHVTIKLKAGFESLRAGEALKIVIAAIARVNEGGLVGIVEFSIQSNHIHLIAEASNSAHLSKGMASFSIGLGMRLNRLWDRVGQGSVFKERFHLTVVKTPTQTRNLLLYVLRNDVHHGLGLGTLDPCSSAPSFKGFQDYQSDQERSCASAEPQTWLLRVGWKEGGCKGPLSIENAPSLQA